MATRLLRLTETDVNRFKNKKAIDVVIPILFIAVVEWGCSKLPGESFRDFLEKNIKGKWEKYVKRFNPHPEKLNEKDCSSFDVSFLLKLIPEVCKDIAANGTPVWSTKDDLKLEWHLTLAKEIRNDVSHQPKGSAVDPSKLAEIEYVVITAIKVAGEKYSVSLQIIDQKIHEVTDQVKEIRQKDLTEREIRIIQYENEFNLKARGEMQKNHKMAIILLPFDHTKLFLKDIFYEVNLTILDETNKGKTILLSDLLHHAKGCCAIVTGQPGAGKSTLLKRLREDFLEETEPEIFYGIRKFPALLYVECRENKIPNCAELLVQHFPETMKKVDNIGDAFVALRGMDLLICVDGLDEINATSCSLVNELIDKFGAFGKATLLLTSRPSSVHEYMKRLENKNITYFTASINLLTEKSQQCSYLRRYEEKLGISAPKLVESFENLDLDDSWETHFSYPIYLMLFCCLYRKYPTQDDKWKSEVSIMEQTLELCKEKVIERLNTLDIFQMNSRTLASDLMEAAYDLSLCLLNEDKLVIDERNYSKMCKKCFKDLEVSYSSLVSCLFLGQSDCADNFQFLHKSHAEYMAAKALFRRLVCDPDVKVSDVIGHVTSAGYWSNEASTVTDEQVQKRRERIKAVTFQNVFRFVTILLVEAGGKDAALENFIGEICPALVSEKVAFEGWAEYTLSCGSSQLVAERTALAAKQTARNNTTGGHSWFAGNPRLMIAASQMLPHHHPSSLFVTPDTKSANITSIQKSLMEVVGQKFPSALSFRHEYSYENFLPVDDFFIPLWSARCQLARFTGCLGTNVLAGQAFVNAVRRSENLGIHDHFSVSLSNPWDHQLHTLEETSRYFVVKVRLDSGKQVVRGPPRPLPQNTAQAPLLTVVCTPDAGVPEVAALIVDLAPRDKRYNCIRLQHWRGEDTALHELLTELDRAGLRTRWCAGAPTWTSTR